MTSSDWNTAVIDEFHANEGRVGGQFAGANMILMHHVGRSSSRCAAGDQEWILLV